MSTATITDKTMVLVSKLGEFWITAEQARIFSELLTAETPTIVTIEGNMLSTRHVDGILTAEAYDVLNKRRTGAWQCKWKHWHDRGQQCAHAQLQR